jgi:hypothetical protein
VASRGWAVPAHGGARRHAGPTTTTLGGQDLP